MKLHIPIFILGLVMICSVGKSQNELHFTQFEAAPLQLNPALVGDFQGTFRIGGIYRDQWFSFLGDEGSSFKTLDMFVDVNIIRGLRKQDWISAGIGYDALDRGGSVGFTSQENGVGIKNTYSRIGAAYHLADKKRKNIFTLGVQRVSKSSSIAQLQYTDDRADGPEDIDNFNMGEPNEDGLFDGSYSDWVFGLTYDRRNAESGFMLGLKLSQLFKPDFQLGSINNEQDPLFAVFANYHMPVGEKMKLMPSVLYQKTGPASELVLQSRLGYNLNEKLSINGGLGFRTGDAVQVLLGAEYKQYTMGVSYDINVSGLTAATGTVGAFELALSYVGNIKKKPKVKPVILCPRL